MKTMQPTVVAFDLGGSHLAAWVVGMRSHAAHTFLAAAQQSSSGHLPFGASQQFEDAALQSAFASSIRDTSD